MSEDVTIHNRPNRKYELVDFDPVWADRFNEIVSKIAPLFGDNLVRIEHVGSTSIPGMVAKPTVDISVEVKDLHLVRDLYDQMKDLGFKPLGDFIQQTEPEEYFVLNGSDSDDRLANIHVMQTGNSEIDDMVTLRDFLRQDVAAREEYVRQKESIKNKFGEADYNSYSKNKRDFLEELKSKARSWKNDQHK